MFLTNELHFSLRVPGYQSVFSDSGDPEPLEEKIQSSSSEEVRDYSWKLTGLQRDRVYIVQLRSCNNQELCSPWSEEKVLNMCKLL